MAVYSTILMSSFSSYAWSATIGAVDAAGNLFGVSGLDSGNGVVFEIAKTATGYAAAPAILASFGGVDGSVPTSIVMDSAGNLFGTTWSGVGYGGTVFEIAKTGNGYATTPTILATLTGLAPSLAFDSAGNLFGEASVAFGSDADFVFEIAKTSNGYSSTPTTLASFDPLAAGYNLVGGLISDAAGNLFGATFNGGTYGGGTVFELVKTGTGYAANVTTLVSFPSTDYTLFNSSFSFYWGGRPTLVIDAAGNLFGTANGSGGSSGSVFEIFKGANGYANTATKLADVASYPSFGLVTDFAGNLYGTSGSAVFEIAKTSTGYAANPVMLGSSTGSNFSIIVDAAGNVFGTSEGPSNAQSTVFELSSLGVTISGTAQVGQTITASAGGGATGYQWEVLVGGNWFNVSGATGATYVLTQANEGRQIRAQAIGLGGVVVATSSPTQAVFTSNGNQNVYETTDRTTIGNGQFQYVYGTAFNTTINSGGEQDVYVGGTSNATQLNSGSFQTVWGTSILTVVNGATQFVWGLDFSARVGSGGAQYVGAGGVANNANIDRGGTQLVWGVANGSDVSGDQKIYAGGAANRAIVFGAQYDWGTATDTDLAGGVQYVYGTASGTTISAPSTVGGIQHVASGGSASNTTIYGSSSQYVYGGGAASVTSLVGGYQFVSGSSDQTAIHSGRQDVYGSVTNTTTDSSGTGQQNIYAGGTATNTTLGAGYYQTNWGAAYNTTLNGGIQNVYGTATNTTINSATSVQYVEAGALASNTTIGSGGTENVLAGGSAAGVTFAGAHAHLVLAHASALTGSISGWQGTDTIDLGDIAFGSQTTLGYAANSNHTGGVLTVSDGSHVATLSLLGQYAAASFALSSDGYGGVLITNPAAAGQVQSVLASPLQA